MALDHSLDKHKTDLDFISFAIGYGYFVDQRESSRASAVLRHANGDKIIVAKSAAGHWVYFSVRDDSDNGTIIDFIQHRKPGATLGHVKRELAAWMGTSPAPALPMFDLKPVTKDRAAVLKNWSRMESVTSHPYLEARGIGGGILGLSRFADTVRIDARKNAVFSHTDDDGVCGYEIKNRGFTGFASGGTKALWLSNRQESDTALVIAESAIDAISHAILKPESSAFYASSAGGWSDVTREMLKRTAASLPPAGMVILAFDQDEQGNHYVEQARELLKDIGREIVLDQPPAGMKDWNDVLRSSLNMALSSNALSAGKERP